MGRDGIIYPKHQVLGRALSAKALNPELRRPPALARRFDMMQAERFSEPEITQILRGHYQHGVRVMRTFGHNDGYGTTMPVQNPIQPRVGVFSEAALRRYDFVMDALSKVRSGQGLAASTALTAGAHVLHGV